MSSPQKKINILITRLGSAYYGAEFYIVRYFSKMQNQLHNIVLLTNQPELQKNFKKSIPKASIITLLWGREVTALKSLIFFITTYPVFFIIFGSILLHQKASKNINVVFLNSLNEKLIVPFWAKLLGIKVVFIEHGNFMTFWYKARIHIILNLFSRLIDEVICVSKQVEDSFRETGLYDELMTVVTAGIDVKMAKESLLKVNKNTVRKNLQISNKDILVLYVGRVEHLKGIDILIKAIAQAKKKVSNVRLLIVGHGNNTNKYIQMAEDLEIGKDVLFYGRTSDTPWFAYKISNIFVQPSRFEGISFVALEASLNKKPIIAAKVGGLMSVFNHRENGLLFERENVDELANYIIELSDNKKLQKFLGDNAYNNVVENFNLDRAVNETYKIITR